MCVFSAPSSPSPPTPTPAPEPAKDVDVAQQQARANAQKKALASGGRTGSLITDSSSLGEAQTQSKQLLGI